MEKLFVSLETQRRDTADLKRMMSYNLIRGTVAVEPGDMLDVRSPFNSTAELMTAEDSLQDEELFNRTVLTWSRYDDRSAANLAREILKRILSNSLASKLVLRQDGEEKDTFEKLLIFTALKSVLKRFPTMEKEIYSGTACWLTSEPFYKGGAGPHIHAREGALKTKMLKTKTSELREAL